MARASNALFHVALTAQSFLNEFEKFDATRGPKLLLDGTWKWTKRQNVPWSIENPFEVGWDSLLEWVGFAFGVGWDLLLEWVGITCCLFVRGTEHLSIRGTDHLSVCGTE